MATIIKNESHMYPSGTPTRQVAFDLNDLTYQANDYLGHVRSEAAKIVQQAKEEAAKVQARAEQAGRKAAEEAIERILDEKVSAQMRTLLPALEGAVSQITDSRSSWQQHWEECVVGLACAIAGRIVRRELQQRPEISLDWIRESLELTSGSAEITLRLNPTDLATLRGEVDRLVGVVRRSAPTRILADESISPGGCRVETEFGSVDQQLETQLERIREELRG